MVKWCSVTDELITVLTILPECRGSAEGRHCGWDTWPTGTCSERGNMVEERRLTEMGALYTESLQCILMQKQSLMIT